MTIVVDNKSRRIIYSATVLRSYILMCVILLVKDICKGHADDSHCLLQEILDYLSA